MSKYISIDEAVASARTLCKGSTDADNIFMRHWAVLGNRDLGLSKENIETNTLVLAPLD